MIARRCAVPGCANDAADIFCLDHYFALPSKQAQFLHRWQFKTQRCEDADTKQHMREQLHGYVQEAIRTLEKSVVPASQAAPESARRPSELAAGAPYHQISPVVIPLRTCDKHSGRFCNCYIGFPCCLPTESFSAPEQGSFL